MYIEKENGILYFISELTDGVVFKTDPFYIYDSSEIVKEYVDTDYTITKTDDYEYLLTVTLDKDYLATKGLTYPVYIDPAVKYNTTSYIDDAPIYSNYPNTNYGGSIVAYLGKHNTYGAGRLLLRFSQFYEADSFFQTFDLNQEQEIVNVRLYLYNQVLGSKSSIIRAHQFEGSENWTESGITWNSTSDDDMGYTACSAYFTGSSNTYYYMDITNIVQHWKGTSSTPVSRAKQGIILVNDNEESVDYARCLYTLNSGSPPYVVINYTTVIPEGTYYIQNMFNQLHAEIEGASTADDVPIQQNAFHLNDYAKWIITQQSDGYYTIKSYYSGKYLAVKNGSTLNNAAIVQSSYADDGSKWTFSLSSSGNYIITSKNGANSDKVLAVPNGNTSNGTDLIQFSYVNDTNLKDEWGLRKADSMVGYFSCWYATVDDSSGDKDTIGYWANAPTFYIDNLAGLSQTQQDYVIDAMDDWDDNIGMTVSQVTNQNNADIIVHLVTSEDYKLLTDNTWPENLYGFTNNIFGNKYYGYYEHTRKEIKEITNSHVYVLYNEQRDEHLKNTIMHEIGHALGYFGHSAVGSDIMYRMRTTIGILSKSDKDHLKQVYDLMN